MWDGNMRIEDGNTKKHPLSENQCGMETERQEREQRTNDWVEREPMWDGNFKREGRNLGGLVEREPMWDGNMTGVSKQRIA